MDVTQREAIIGDFLAKAGWGGAERRLLAADASFRRYDRLTRGANSVILMDAPPPKEDVRPFMTVARYLTGLGYSAPRIWAADPEQGLLLLEDFGDATYTRLLATGADEASLYRLATNLLIDLRHQKLPTDLPPYDATKLLQEARLLIDWTAPALGIVLNDAAIAAYLSAWQSVLPLAFGVPIALVMRDFHVDNLMRLDGRDGIKACGLLDFQDALIGPVTYDLVSLVEDARRDVPAHLRRSERAHYLAHFSDLDTAAFDASWACLAAQRHAKVIGIFTRLARRDGKPGYLRHIERVWRLLDEALQHPGLAPVKDWLDGHIPKSERRTPLP
jgi:aminoglycoside/choline kinase family phosphotransferase